MSFSKRSEHVHTRLKWNHEKWKTINYLKVCVRTAALLI